MSKFTDKVRSIFHRRRPLAKEDAHEIDDWVNEGGTPHPDGPPIVIDVKNTSDDKDTGKRPRGTPPPA